MVVKNICKDVNICKQVEALRSHDWASDAQFARAVHKVCSVCKDFKHKEYAYD